MHKNAAWLRVNDVTEHAGCNSNPFSGLRYMFNALIVISAAEKQYHTQGFMIRLMSLIMSTRYLATVFSASSAKREINHLDPEAFLGEENNEINYQL